MIMFNNFEFVRLIDYINFLFFKFVDEDIWRFYSKVKDLVKNINIVFISFWVLDLYFKEVDLLFIWVIMCFDVLCSDVIKVVNDCELVIR